MHRYNLLFPVKGPLCTAVRSGGLVRFTLARVLSSAGPYSKLGENMRSAGVGAISSRYLSSIRLNDGGNVHNHRRENSIRYALKPEASPTVRPTPGSAHSYELCTPMIRKWTHPRDIGGRETVNIMQGRCQSSAPDFNAPPLLNTGVICEGRRNGQNRIYRVRVDTTTHTGTISAADTPIKPSTPSTA